jgi:hypothetical protein
MMLFVFTLVLMFSVSAMLYLMVRALPRLEEAAAPERRGLLDRWAHSEIPEKIDASFNTFLLKFLRRFKVFVLRLDNAVSGHLRKIHHETSAGDSKIDFKDISGAKDEDPQI